MVFLIPENVQSGTYKTIIKGIDDAIDNLLRIQKQLSDSPSAALPNGFQDQDEAGDFEKNVGGVESQLDGLVEFAKKQTTMRIDRSKM